MAGNDPKSDLPSPSNASEIDLGAVQMNTNGFLGGGSCVSDRSMTVMGASITVPLSKICGYILPLRAVIMLIALLASFRMLSGVILRE